jgi:hypothetical protein
MERLGNQNSGVAVVVLGAPLPRLARELPSVTETSGLPAEAQDRFLLLNLEESRLSPVLDELLAKGISPDQLVVCLHLGHPARVAFDPLVGTLEVLETDPPEELWQRLQARLETQKHKRLAAAVEQARQVGLSKELAAEEWLARLEAAHLTHAFCCALPLPPSRHRAALQHALRQGQEGDAPWSAGLCWEQVFPLSARLALRHWQDPALFREELRRRSALLPFRLRTDLRNVVERCLESVWKGFRHAA